MKGKKGNGRVHVTETPDVSHIRNIDVTHEASDVDVKGIGVFIVGLTVLTIATYFLMLAMFDVLLKREAEPRPAPMAMSEKERMPPEPRLQSAPGFAANLEKEVSTPEPANEGAEGARAIGQRMERPKGPLWEIDVLQEHGLNILNHGGKDQNGNPILPIDEAKSELLKQGLAAQTATPTDTAGLPTAASSARVNAKQ